MVQAESLLARTKVGQRLADGCIVQCRQPQPLHWPPVAAVFEQFPGDHFAFAVGVRGDDQFAGLAQQTLDRLELAGSLGLDLHFPLLRHDGEIVEAPALVAGIVAVRWGGFEQVADAPGHAEVGALPAAVRLARCAEHAGDVFGLGGFFTEKQAHDRRRFLVG